MTRDGRGANEDSHDKPGGTEGLKLRLYIAGGAPNSLLALANATTICAEHFPDSHHLEVIDLLEQPTRAFADGIIVTPTLLRVAPLPVRRLIGTLEDRERALLALRSR